MHDVKRQTVNARAYVIAEAADNADPFIAWCDTNYEADAQGPSARCCGSPWLREEIEKEDALEAFAPVMRVIITKPSVAGFWAQLAARSEYGVLRPVVLYEDWYQAVRRRGALGRRALSQCIWQ